MPGFKRLTAFATAMPLVPEPALEVDVFDPYEVLVPYSKKYVVVRPLGSTAPFRRALVAPTELAADVETPGGSPVANVTSAPLVVPTELVPTSRK